MLPEHLERLPYDARLAEWVEKFKTLSPEQQEAQLLRVRRQSILPARFTHMRLTPDLSRVSCTDHVTAEDSSTQEMSARVMALIQFIRERFGKRCVDAARAIMDGAESCAQIGVKMGVCRHTAIGHLKNLQSKDVKRKAIELGLVTRPSFLAALQRIRIRCRGRAKRRRTVGRSTKRVAQLA